MNLDLYKLFTFAKGMGEDIVIGPLCLSVYVCVHNSKKSQKSIHHIRVRCLRDMVVLRDNLHT